MNYWTEYSKYLRSEAWRLKRQRALNTKGRWCRGCLSRIKVLQVHHKTHKNVPNEPLSDLEILCVDCHRELTSLQRKNPRVDGFTIFKLFTEQKRRARVAQKKKAHRPK